jgi:hypothetical protein
MDYSAVEFCLPILFVELKSLAETIEFDCSGTIIRISIKQ